MKRGADHHLHPSLGVRHKLEGRRLEGGRRSWRRKWAQGIPSARGHTSNRTKTSLGTDLLIHMKNSKRYTLGIDPGRSTGFAIFDRQTNEIVHAGTVNFWQLFREILVCFPPNVADVVVEDARLNNPTFREHGDIGAGKREKISRNVGSVQAESRLIIEGLQLLGYDVLPIRPAGEKWDAQTVARITGYTHRTSGHARDAIRFCYGVKSIRNKEARQ